MKKSNEKRRERLECVMWSFLLIGTFIIGLLCGMKVGTSIPPVNVWMFAMLSYAIAFVFFICAFSKKTKRTK